MSLCIPRRHTGEAEMLPHTFLTVAIDGAECSASCPRLLYFQAKNLWCELNMRVDPVVLIE
jgi:hypothetical protein